MKDVGAGVLSPVRFSFCEIQDDGLAKTQGTAIYDASLQSSRNSIDMCTVQGMLAEFVNGWRRRPGYAVSQKKCKRTERVFGWQKTGRRIRRFMCVQTRALPEAANLMLIDSFEALKSLSTGREDAVLRLTGDWVDVHHIMGDN